MRHWARRLPGLALGPDGWAWVYLHLLDAGLTREDDALRRGLFRALARRLGTRPVERWSSPLIGDAAPLVAALASRRYPEFASLLPALSRHWLTSCAATRETDVMLGRAGALLACAEIQGLAGGVLPPDFVREQHAATRRALESLLRTYPRRPIPLGFAHGLAGYLFALESARAAFGLRLAPSLRAAALEVLEEQARPGPERSAFWDHSSRPPGRPRFEPAPAHAWCHGGPGIALALLGGHRLTGIEAYRALGLSALAGVHRLRVPGRAVQAVFCCGGVGAAQVLVEGYRLTRQARWLGRARALRAELAPFLKRKTALRGFHRGSLGRAYLDWRLRAPSALPLPALGALSL